MCQGQAISVLCRAFHVSKNNKYLKAARAAIQVFQKSSQVLHVIRFQIPFSRSSLRQNRSRFLFVSNCYLFMKVYITTGRWCEGGIPWLLALV
jgi:hypothetical protein